MIGHGGPPPSDSEIDRLAERFRIYLNLKNWDEQAAWAADLARSHGVSATGRRSGRTTRGMLRAISYPSSNMDVCINIGRELIAKLSMGPALQILPDIRVNGPLSDCVMYVDHHVTDRKATR